MRLPGMLLIALILLAAPVRAFQTPREEPPASPAVEEPAPEEARPQEEPAPDQDLPQKGVRIESVAVRLDYLNKDDVVQDEDYYRASAALDFTNRFLNPSAGVEFQARDSQLRAYWIGDDIKIDQYGRVNIRLNHVEWPEWEAAINHLNVYYSYQRWWARLAVGMGYATLVFDPDRYRDPFNFDADAPESRLIYNVSLRPVLWKERLEVDMGLRNFDNFEYHGFDDNGYHIEPIFHLSHDTSMSFFYERRYAAAFISVPTLVRVTWMVSIEHRF